MELGHHFTIFTNDHLEQWSGIKSQLVAFDSITNLSPQENHIMLVEVQMVGNPSMLILDYFAQVVLSGWISYWVLIQ